MKEFVTERLRLRGWRRDDAPALAAMNADPEVMRYIGSGAKPYAEALERAGRLVRERPGKGLGLWAIEESATGVFHGWAGLIPLDGTQEFKNNFIKILMHIYCYWYSVYNNFHL